MFSLTKLASGRRLAAKLVKLMAVALLLPGVVAAQTIAGSPDKSESPYFFVDSHDPDVDRLPLKSTRVDVRIVGVIADVTVTQHYRNEGKNPIEARYVFPGSTRAAVHGMEVQLGDRLLKAQIREKQQAKAEYEQAKQEGKTTALLEQHRPNVFQMNVANIMPNDDIRVELRYTELMVPTNGIYKFVFPTVVGPRYNGKVGGESNKQEKWISTPYHSEGKLAKNSFQMNVMLVSPTGIQEVASPSHSIALKGGDKHEMTISLDETERHGNNRDFVLDYRLAGEKIESGLIISRGEKENFFLAMIEPPKNVDSSQIVPSEYIFVVDVSGSMHGFPLVTSKELMRRLLRNLRPGDSFNLLTFSGDNTVLAPKSLPATRENINRAINALDRQEGHGGTELLPALRHALSMPSDKDRSRTFVVITDGYVTVEREAFKLIRENLNKANLFAFGIGSSVNRELIEGMARAGQGEPFVVLAPEFAEAEAERFRKMIDSPVLTHIKVRSEGFDTYDMAATELPDVFSQRPVILFGKWRGKAKGQLVLEGQSASGPYRAVLPVLPDESRREADSALRYLWARHRIAALSDQENLEGGSSYRYQILELGLNYNLLTQYTSFIAVDEIVRNSNPAEMDSVDQPLPLPKGVSNYAVGANVGATPEPAVWAMLMIALMGMTWMWLRRRAACARY